MSEIQEKNEGEFFFPLWAGSEGGEGGGGRGVYNFEKDSPITASVLYGIYVRTKRTAMQVSSNLFLRIYMIYIVPSYPVNVQYK